MEPISITSLSVTVVAILSYLGKKGLKRLRSKGIHSDCGVEVTDVIENTKIEIVNELKEFIRVEIQELFKNDDNIVVKRNMERL